MFIYIYIYICIYIYYRERSAYFCAVLLLTACTYVTTTTFYVYRLRVPERVPGRRNGTLPAILALCNFFLSILQALENTCMCGGKIEFDYSKRLLILEPLLL
jgi:hypothetical protein